MCQDENQRNKELKRIEKELKKEGLLDKLVDLKHGQTLFIDS